MTDDKTSTMFLPERETRRVRDHVGKRHGRFAAWMVGLSFAGDIAATVGGLLLAFWLRFHTPMRTLGHVAEGAMPLSEYRGHMIFLTFTLMIILVYSGLYGTGRPQRLRKVNALVLTSCVTWCMANLALSFELNTMPIVSRIFLLNTMLCAALALIFWRWLFDGFLLLPAVAALLERRIVFVGWSDQAARMLGHIKDDPKHYYQIAGCVPAINGAYDLDPPQDVPQLGEYTDLKEVMAERSIDLAIVADQNPTRGELRDLVTLCEKEMVHLQVIPSAFQVLISGLHLETTSGVPVLGISRLPLDSPWAQLLKRAVDIVGAVIGLLFSAPVIAVFGLLVYIESPGPVFYRQRRGGVGGELFDILKIRSMRLDAERTGKPGWSTKEDSRRLKIGSFMRRWNIDEVPQFLNVLLGHMSLVGPRPERPEFIASFKEEIPHYNARHGVKPGITGWAQVNGLRGDTDLTERIRCDLYYIENWSLALDCQIMLMTFFKQQNAH